MAGKKNSVAAGVEDTWAASVTAGMEVSVEVARHQIRHMCAQARSLEHELP